MQIKAINPFFLLIEPKYKAAKGNGKSLNKLIVSKLFLTATRSITLTDKTEIKPPNEVINAPTVGAKKSNKVKLVFEPTMLVKGICKAIKPRIVKIAVKMILCLVDFLINIAKKILMSRVKKNK